jgi:4,5-DOPA dioxygenase extradiol
VSATPVLFVSHGAPTIALEQGAYPDALARFGAEVRPRAVVVVSAHWTTEWVVGVTSADRHRLIYDFGGFPPELYRLQYPAAGEPGVAARAAALLEAAGFATRLDSVRGLDHGAWIPLRLVWPAADVPVVQIAMPEVPPAALVRFGHALAPLRDEGVLVFASGGVVHNLAEVRFGDRGPVDHWARGFEAWVAERLAAADTDALLRWRELAPHAARAAPTTEHFDPLLVAHGARREADRLETLHEGFEHGNLSLRSFAFREGGTLPAARSHERKEHQP